MTTRTFDGNQCVLFVYSFNIEYTDASMEMTNSHQYDDVDISTVKTGAPLLSRSPMSGDVRRNNFGPTRMYKLWSHASEKILLTCYDPVNQVSCATEIYEHELLARRRLIKAGALCHQTLDHLACKDGTPCLPRICACQPVAEERYLKEKLNTVARHQRMFRIRWIESIIAAVEAADRHNFSQLQLEANLMAEEDATMQQHFQGTTL